MPKRNTRSSWIDPERMRDLVEKVRPGSTARSQTRPSASPNVEADDYVLDPVPGGPSRVKEEISPLPEQTTVPFLPFVGSTSPRLETRLTALLNWVKEQSAASLVFVVDAYGAALAKDPADCDDAFLASASNLADALGRGREYFSRPDQGALHLELRERSEFLCLVHGKWDASTVAVGVLRKEPLPCDLAVEFRKALENVGRPPSGRRERD